METYLTDGTTMPDVVLIERWDPAYAAALDDLPRVWLDRSAAAHDEIIADTADPARSWRPHSLPPSISAAHG